MGASPAGRICKLALLTAAGVLLAGQARASESGASLYLLGAGGPGAAAMPPLKGVFFDNVAYFYAGDSGGGKQFVLGGNVVADVHASLPADFATVLWVPTTDFLGGTLAVGGALPVVHPSVHVNAVITGPRGLRVGVSAADSATIIGDPLATAMLGWKTGRTALQLSTQLNIPVGDYRDGELANVAFHRWIDDVSFAATWHDPASGWDVSGKLGVTFNGKNDATDYTTGTESHYELAVEKTLSPAWSAGLQAYYFYQLTGDTGAGAVLGPYKGRVGGVGATVAWNVKAGKAPLSVRVRGLHEFAARNRLEGDSLWLELSLPLSVKLPPGARLE